MIRVDSRTGSGELEKYFRPYGLRVEKAKLEFGDFDWQGLGPKGECAVVLERKRIDDLVQSMTTGRLSGFQLNGLAENYDYGYLVVEGIWRPGPGGELEVSNGHGGWQTRRMHTRAITNYVMGLAFRAGLTPWRTSTPEDTVSFVVDQYRMWTDKEWHEHKSHDTVYAPADPSGALRGMRLSFVPRRISLAEKVAMQLPGLDDKARYAAQAFPTVRKLVNASFEEWEGMGWKTRGGKARKLGAASARKIVDAMGL